MTSSFTVNGAARSLPDDADTLLIDVLREEIGLTGTKLVCGAGVCGACAVLLDGKPVASCLLPARAARGKSVVTVEGIGGEALHPVQKAFIACDALQCGFCTPGFIVAAKALLDENPNPTETEARYWLAGNLCRCTGYDKIIRAVMDAAAEMRGAAR